MQRVAQLRGKVKNKRLFLHLKPLGWKTSCRVMRVEQITSVVATGGHKNAALGWKWLSSHLARLPSLELHQLASALGIILFFPNSHGTQLGGRGCSIYSTENRGKMQSRGTASKRKDRGRAKKKKKKKKRSDLWSVKWISFDCVKVNKCYGGQPSPSFSFSL